MVAADFRVFGFAQKERLKHVEFMLYFLGTISRSELMERFGIGSAAASRDISTYIELAGANANYDNSKKCYFRTNEFEPKFDFNASYVLGILSGGTGAAGSGGYVLADRPAQLNEPCIDVVAAISNAIHQQAALSIIYRSVSSGETKREIVPFALVDNGLRWHVRAYDRKRERFSDFVLTRITEPAIIDSGVSKNELISADDQWNRVVELILVPHPTRDNPEAIEMDYNMEHGELKIKVKAAVAGYVLRRWNVDCSNEHTLEGSEYHLWLKNRLALYGVEGLAIAPGFDNRFE